MRQEGLQAKMRKNVKNQLTGLPKQILAKIF